MSVTEYKNYNKIKISEENRGQRVKEKDRKLFERDLIPISFGKTVRDKTEFALYDISSNLLAWKVDRFDDIILTGGIHQKEGGAPEILVEPLEDINEVGYEKGSFRFSYQFFRNRVGSHIDNDKVFISEVSPSRREVRILPVFTGDYQVDSKIKHDFQHFKHNDLDKVDVIDLLNKIMDEMDVQTLKELFNSLFLSHFQEDYVVSGQKLNFILEAIRNETKSKIQEELNRSEDEFLSLEEARSLFIDSLVESIDKYIPYLS